MYFAGPPSTVAAIYIIIFILAIENNFYVKFVNTQHLMVWVHDFLPWENILLICNIDTFKTLSGLHF